jgi:hypothetical protein
MDGWELIAITANNVAYLKREVEPKQVHTQRPLQEDTTGQIQANYR